MILSFIIIRKVPQGVLKSEGYALRFQHSPRDLANVNEWKIMFDPYIVSLFCHFSAYARQLDGMLEKKINELTQLRG